ncbi:MAG: AzlD domain-containing protein [Spirochaetales bacterium]|nr:AzlD domain-containing protein [Spirochaetales bacterium]
MSLYEIAVLGGMFAVTFGVRYLLIGFSSRIRLSPAFERALAFVPPAVLTAIIIPSVLMPDGSRFDLSLANAYIPAALAALGAHLVMRRLIVTIVFGMAVFFLWKMYF